jgi:hypothetical protein
MAAAMFCIDVMGYVCMDSFFLASSSAFLSASFFASLAILST